MICSIWEISDRVVSYLNPRVITAKLVYYPRMVMPLQASIEDYQNLGHFFSIDFDWGCLSLCMVTGCKGLARLSDLGG